MASRKRRKKEKLPQPEDLAKGLPAEPQPKTQPSKLEEDARKRRSLNFWG